MEVEITAARVRAATELGCRAITYNCVGHRVDILQICIEYMNNKRQGRLEG